MATTSKLSSLAQQRSTVEYDKYSRESLKWFTSKIINLKNPVRLANQIRDEGRTGDRFMMGGLYYFYYDAKLKDRLEYWDAFPLVIPIERYRDGFLGLNLHYLPPKIRAGFMDKLMDFAIYDDNDEVKRLRVTYEILSASRRYREFLPCLKRYLFSHVASKILKVQANEWETAVFLPTHQFQGAKVNKVWKDSEADVKGYALNVGSAKVIGQV